MKGIIVIDIKKRHSGVIYGTNNVNVLGLKSEAWVRTERMSEINAELKRLALRINGRLRK